MSEFFVTLPDLENVFSAVCQAHNVDLHAVCSNREEELTGVCIDAETCIKGVLRDYDIGFVGSTDIFDTYLMALSSYPEIVLDIQSHLRTSIGRLLSAAHELSFDGSGKMNTVASYPLAAIGESPSVFGSDATMSLWYVSHYAAEERMEIDGEKSLAVPDSVACVLENPPEMSIKADAHIPSSVICNAENPPELIIHASVHDPATVMAQADEALDTIVYAMAHDPYTVRLVETTGVVWGQECGLTFAPPHPLASRTEFMFDSVCSPRVSQAVPMACDLPSLYFFADANLSILPTTAFSAHEDIAVIGKIIPAPNGGKVTVTFMNVIGSDILTPDTGREVDLVPEHEASFAPLDGRNYYSSDHSHIPLIEGQAYKVVWGDDTYISVATQTKYTPGYGSLTMVTLGNPILFTGPCTTDSAPTEEPFLIWNGGFISDDDTPVRTVRVYEDSNIKGFTLDEEFGLFSAKIPSTSIKEGRRYFVEWDGLEYDFTAAYYEAIDKVGFGNAALFGIGSDTGEPFAIGNLGTDLWMFTADKSPYHHVSIRQDRYQTSVVCGQACQDPIESGLIEAIPHNPGDGLRYAWAGWSTTGGGTGVGGILDQVDEDMTLYPVFEPVGDLDDISWETISAHSQANVADQHYKVGDTKKIVLTESDGSTRVALAAIAGFALHRDADGVKQGITWILRGVSTSAATYNADVNALVYDTLPEDLKTVAQQSTITECTFDSKNSVVTSVTTTPYVFMPEITNISSTLTNSSGGTGLKYTIGGYSFSLAQWVNSSDAGIFPLFDGMSKAEIAQFFGLDAAGDSFKTRTMLYGAMTSPFGVTAYPRAIIEYNSTYTLVKNYAGFADYHFAFCFRV